MSNGLNLLQPRKDVAEIGEFFFSFKTRHLCVALIHGAFEIVGSYDQAGFLREPVRLLQGFESS